MPGAPVPYPRRIRRTRGKGKPLPAGAVYVGRPTRWGNPFTGRCSGHAKSVIVHRAWLRGEIGALTLERMGFSPGEIDALDRLRAYVLTNLHRLARRDLACWCPLSSEWCHGATLLTLAASHADYERHAA